MDHFPMMNPEPELDHHPPKAADMTTLELLTTDPTTTTTSRTTASTRAVGVGTNAAAVSCTESPPVPLPVPLSQPLPGKLRNSKQGGFARARSLSRVFNQVPADRPVFETAQTDLLEYYCHLCCLQNNYVEQEKAHLSQALFTLSSPLRRYGRLWSRLQIASLSISLAGLNVGDNDEDENVVQADHRYQQQHPPVEPAKQEPTSQIWHELIHQLRTVQKYLLRQDANLNVPLFQQQPSSTSQTTMVPTPNPSPDKVLQQHVMFQSDYREALQLLQVQRISALFRERVQQVCNLQVLQKVDAATTAAVNTAKHLETHVVEYQAALTSLFGSPSAVPLELVSFLVVPPNASPATAQQLIQASLAIARGASTTFSFSTVQQKTRDLLLKWSESILSIPTLVRLGYGGVRTPIVAEHDEAHDSDDVSSYGVDAELDDLDASECHRGKRKRQGPNTSATSAERFGETPARGNGNKSAQVTTVDMTTTTNKENNEEEQRTNNQGTNDNNETVSDIEEEPEISTLGLTASERRRPEKRPRRRSSLESTATPSSSHDSRTDHSAATAPASNKPKAGAATVAAAPPTSSRNDRNEQAPTAKFTSVAASDNHPKSSSNNANKKPKASIRTVSEATPITTSTATATSGLTLRVPRFYAEPTDGEMIVTEKPSASVTNGRSAGPAAVPSSLTDSQEKRLWQDAVEHGRQKTRKMEWTEEESDAVREGYMRFGPKWRLIKDNCEGRLCRRTNIQIKDKFRTMVRRGEIIEFKTTASHKNYDEGDDDN